MSEGLAGVIIVCVTLILITLVISLTKLVLNREAKPVAPERMGPQPDGMTWKVPAGGSKEAFADRFMKAAQEAAEHNRMVDAALAPADPDRTPAPDAAPAPFDSDNPPVKRIYRRKPGSTAPVPQCFCHRRPLKEGQEILWWPLPGSQEIRIYCQRAEGE